VNTDNVTREDWIVAGLALLLAIALLFFPWFHLSVTIGAFSASADYSATSSPDGWLGVLALIATVLVLVDIAVERMSPDTEIPAVRGSRTETRFILAAVAAGFIALKFLFHIHFSLFGWGFYATVIIAAALVYFTLQERGSARSYVAGTSRPGGASAAATPAAATPGTPTDSVNGEGTGTAPAGEPEGAATPGGSTTPEHSTTPEGSATPGGSTPPPGA
jgi:hypothetical protein